MVVDGWLCARALQGGVEKRAGAGQGGRATWRWKGQQRSQSTTPTAGPTAAAQPAAGATAAAANFTTHSHTTHHTPRLSLSRKREGLRL